MKRIWTPQGVQPDVIQADSCFISWLPLFLRLDSVPSWNVVEGHSAPNDKETFDSLAFAYASAGNGSSMCLMGCCLPPVMEGCSTAPPICLLQQAAGPLPFKTGRHSPSMMGIGGRLRHLVCLCHLINSFLVTLCSSSVTFTTW